MTPRSHIRRLVLAWSTLAWTTLLAGPPAQVRADTPREPLSAAELAGLRGGFLVADGVKLDFAAQVRTFVDGALALETSLAWTPQGAVSATSVADGVAKPVLDASSEAVQAAGVDIGGLVQPGDSVAVTDSGGTILLHRTTADTVQNFIFNTASDQNIRQEVDINLVLPGFEAVQAEWNRGLIGLRIGADADTAAVGAVTH